MTRRAAGDAGPLFDVGARPAERKQQLAQAVLRMRRFERVPARLVHVSVEARQDDGTLRQLGDRCEEVTRGGLRAGRARGDHRRCRRIRAPASGLVADRARASLDRIDPSALGQDLRPGLADDGQEPQGALPVGREVALDEPLELAEGHAFDGEFVEQAAQFARELQGLRRDCAMGCPWSSLKRATNCASSASRSAVSMAGGSVRASPSPDAISHSPSSTSPSGAMRGRIVGCRWRRAGRLRAGRGPSAGSAAGSARRPAPADRPRVRRAPPAPARRRSGVPCRW